MERKKALYLVGILAILLAALPLLAAAQPVAPGSAAAESVGNEALPTALDAKLASDGPAAPAAPAVRPDAILYDNGPLVTNVGAGAGGADASAVQTAVLQSTYGFGNQVLNGNRMADDFTVPAGGWNISTITFYAYQTGSTTTTTINDVRLQIWDGVPGVGGSSVVFGDTTTNRLAGSSWSNIYRVLDTGLLDSTRPIMANVVTVNTILPAGTYWLDWVTGGTLASGPWAPPVTLPGQTAKPGANGMQSLAGAAFAPAIDAGSGAVQDLPFVIEGAGATGPSISLVKTVGTIDGPCATTSSITVPEGTTVYYCYEVTNTGDEAFNAHDLVDDQLGTLLTGFPYVLAPGASVFATTSAVMNTTTTNVGTWTAHNAAGAPSTATSTATVNVTLNRCPAGSTEVAVLTEDFEGTFPPTGWTVTNSTTGCTGVPEWINTDPGANGNLTGGSGLFANADSDQCGSGSIMNTQMWTAPLDFTGLTNPMVSYYTDYNDIATTSDVADLDFSTDGGATWSNLLSWNEDHRGPLLVEQPFAADGQANTLVRWNYTDATWDWWWQVDSVRVTACEVTAGVPGLALTKTVGTVPGVCAATSSINVPAGTTVYYCYTATNTGTVAFGLHTLVDDQLGPIFSGFAYALAPGASVNTVAEGFNASAVMSITTTNVATWTASTAAGGPSTEATATATVTVIDGPPVAEIPTLSPGGLAGLGALIALAAFWLLGVRRRTA
ncbi:MAG: hypothetical protein ABI689_00930 [Thermoanaerobaculia bacterium]